MKKVSMFENYPDVVEVEPQNVGWYQPKTGLPPLGLRHRIPVG